MPSQFGEERLIDSIFPQDFKGYAVDVGASDGIFLSNTWPLEMRGWTVLCIEPNKAFACEKRRKLVLSCAVAAEEAEEAEFTIVTMGPNQGFWSAVSALKPDADQLQAHLNLTQSVNKITVPVRTLDSCLAQSGFPRLDFVSIDTEGGDMDVLRGWDIGKWLPKLIIIENWSGDDRFINYLSPYGYERVQRLGVNDCFVRKVSD